MLYACGYSVVFAHNWETWLECVAVNIHDLPLTCCAVRCTSFFLRPFYMLTIGRRGDKLRIVNTTLTVGSRAVSARTEVCHYKRNRSQY